MFCQRYSLQGQVLSQIAAKFLDAADIVPNWLEATPDLRFLWKRCEPFKVEMVIRGCQQDMLGENPLRKAYAVGFQCQIKWWKIKSLKNQF